jgi:endonuclease III
LEEYQEDRQEAMAETSQSRVIEGLLQRHGRTFAEELGIPVEDGTPSALFRLLCASLLFSARISAGIAVSAARALAEQGWTTPQKMADSSWEQRARVLNESGYARYDERTTAMLGDTCQMLLDRYGGDLRNLREEAGHQVPRERKLLMQFPGNGNTGADIFFREAQVAWDELYPFADRRVLETARKLNLEGDPQALSGMVDDSQFPRLAAALVRARLERDIDGVLQAAREASD